MYRSLYQLVKLTPARFATTVRFTIIKEDTINGKQSRIESSTILKTFWKRKVINEKSYWIIIIFDFQTVITFSIACSNH